MVVTNCYLWFCVHSPEEYDELLKYAVVVSDYYNYCHVHRTQEYDELLKYAVVVSEYKLSRSSTIVMFTGGAQVVEVCIANGDA